MAGTVETVTALIGGLARAQSSSPAVVYQGNSTSYGELADMAGRAAAGLAALGVGAGDRVALWLPNTPAYLALYLGCAQLGAIAVAVNTRFRATEVADIVGRSGARVLAMWPGFRSIDFLGILAEADPQALDRLETLILYDEGDAVDGVPAAVAACRRVRYTELVDRPAVPGGAVASDTGCNIFTTSGTTRAPKFVLHTHGSIARHADIVADRFGYRASTGGTLLALPFCGVFGFTQLMAALASGRPGVIVSAFDAGECLRLIDRHNVQHLNATDDMLQAMMDTSDREIVLPSVIAAGTARFATDFDAFAARAERRGLTLFGLYGMSEVQALYAKQRNDAPPERRYMGGGIPVSRDAAVRVRDPDDGRLLAVGEAGELEFSGPSLMREYYGNAAATAEAFTADGFLRSGDLGYLTDEGGFVFLQRMGDVLRLGGFLVSPAEIEGHLLGHPAVSDCQVIGISTQRGTRPVGFVIPADPGGFDEAALQAHCRHGLAKFKVPVRIFPLREFPTTKSANGTKVQRARLREMAAELTDPSGPS